MTTIDPIRKYEIQGQVSTVQSGVFALAVGTDTLLIECVSNERIRVMGWVAQSATATVGNFQLTSETTGPIMTPLAVPGFDTGTSNTLDVTDSGYMETSTGDGLYCDVVTADVNLTLFYIIYKAQ